MSFSKQTGAGIFFGLFLILTLAWPSDGSTSNPNRALQQQAEESFPDMPTYNIFTREELQKKFDRLEFRDPLDRPELGFSILLPKDWEGIPITISREELDRDDETTISLTLYQSPKKDAAVEVAYCRVPETTKLEEWAPAYLEGNNLEVLHVQRGKFSGRDVYDTLIKAPGDYKVRMTFSRHVDKIYIISGSTTSSLYEKYMKIFGLAALSFTKL
ncbi:MAG: hypothetical protein ACUVV5_11245 [Candidatus Aminicenantales bacterium]